MRISHEAIYQALYVQGPGALRRELTACLRTGRALRKPRRLVDQRRERIKVDSSAEWRSAAAQLVIKTATSNPAPACRATSRQWRTSGCYDARALTGDSPAAGATPDRSASPAGRPTLTVDPAEAVDPAYEGAEAAAAI